MNALLYKGPAFYQNLGKLFYAIAAIDGTVKSEELKKLQELVKTDWLKTDVIGASHKVDAENAIVNTFKWLNDDNEYDAQACYNSFISFKKNNEPLFTNKINTLIMHTAGKIASSFSGTNKSELILLAKLNLEFKKT